MRPALLFKGRDDHALCRSPVQPVEQTRESSARRNGRAYLYMQSAARIFGRDKSHVHDRVLSQRVSANGTVQGALQSDRGRAPGFAPRVKYDGISRHVAPAFHAQSPTWSATAAIAKRTVRKLSLSRAEKRSKSSS